MRSLEVEFTHQGATCIHHGDLPEESKILVNGTHVASLKIDNGLLSVEVQRGERWSPMKVATVQPPGLLEQEVFEHLVVSEVDGVMSAACGKVWTAESVRGGTVVGKCPACEQITFTGWSA